MVSGQAKESVTGFQACTSMRTAVLLVLHLSATSSNYPGRTSLHIFASAVADSPSFYTAVSESQYPRYRFQYLVSCPFSDECFATTFSPSFPDSLYSTVFPLFHGGARFCTSVLARCTGFTPGVMGDKGGEGGMPIDSPPHHRQVIYLVDRRRIQVMSHCLRGCRVAGGTH